MKEIRTKSFKIEIVDAHYYQSTGEEFYNAFWILIKYFSPSRDWREPILRPVYYCSALALELFLKSYLSINGINDFDKGRKGHDLISLISKYEILKSGFNFNNTDIKQICLLNKCYYYDENLGKDSLRYLTKTGVSKLPCPDALNKLLKKVKGKLSGELLAKEKML